MLNLQDHSHVFLLQNLKIIIHAVSLGGAESLVCHPASTTHCDAYVSPEDKKISGITDNLLRLRYVIVCASKLKKLADMKP